LIKYIDKVKIVKSSNQNRRKILLISVFSIIIIFIIYSKFVFISSPNAELYEIFNFSYDNIHEAAEQFGDDLLISDFFLAGKSEFSYISANLLTKKDGSLEDKKSWVSLNIAIYYGSSDLVNSEFFEEEAYMSIHFDPKHFKLFSGLVYNYDYSLDINDINIHFETYIDENYKEKNTQFVINAWKYSSSSRFIYENKLYLIGCRTNSDENFMETIVKNMLK